MNENETDIIESTNDEEVESTEETSEETITDWEAEAKKARGIAARLRTKLTKATEKKVEPQATGELDEAQLDYLDLKGFTDEDEVGLVQKITAKTGQTVRQVLKDDYFLAKLETLRKDKEVKNATPSSTKRGGGQTNDLDTAVARFDQNGELPTDFKLRSQVVNAIEERSNTNKPGWH